MIASKDQTLAIRHGLEGAPNWVEIERPVGPQDLPAWVKGLHIDWMMGWANSPRVKFKCATQPMPKDVLWEQGENGRWFREHEGVMQQHWHSGALSNKDDNGKPLPEGHWQTTKQNGYAGATFTIKLKDGRTVHLRGPWFGGSPAGYSELTVVDMSDPYHLVKQGKVKYEIIPDSGRFIHINVKAKAWWKNGGNFGCYVSDGILIKAIAKYYPHVRIALDLREKRGDAIEPFLDEWDMPKRQYQDQQRNR
jgi:hypothetical protein